MNFEIVTTDDFERAFKRLSKKYHSLVKDYNALCKELKANPTMGDEISGGVRKIRMAITSKGKGKSGGARIISCNVLVDVENTEIYLLTIYDKGAQSSISTTIIDFLKKRNGLD